VNPHADLLTERNHLLKLAVIAFHMAVARVVIWKIGTVGRNRSKRAAAMCNALKVSDPVRRRSRSVDMAHDDDQIALGSALRQLRTSAGKSLRDVGRAAGRSAQAIYSYEIGTRPLQWSTLMRILRFLGSTPAAIGTMLGFDVVPAPAKRRRSHERRTAMDAFNVDRAILGDLNGDELMDVIGFVRSLRAKRLAA
jgi:transcriptional regulator with XRE-family HTH domain